jgi:hypothetical protein
LFHVSLVYMLPIQYTVPVLYFKNLAHFFGGILLSYWAAGQTLEFIVPWQLLESRLYHYSIDQASKYNF